MLRDLSEQGLPDHSTTVELSRWCWAEAENTGDARYCGLARALEQIADAWFHKSGFATATFEELNLLLRSHVDEVLVADTARDGADHARWLREQISLVLLQAPDPWQS